MNSLAELVQLYQKFGDETAFVYHRGYRTPRWTYGQTAELAFRFAWELGRRNIGKGDRVVLWGQNSPEWVAAFVGCMLRGAVAVPMDRIAAPDLCSAWPATFKPNWLSARVLWRNGSKNGTILSWRHLLKY